MRFLCLHGFATSADMMQQQMQPIIAQLPGDWEFEYLDAEMEPSEVVVPSLGSIPKPNYSWYNLPFREDVDRAYQRLTSFIESEGPFDGVWGFSQGGSMAILALLMRQAQLGGSSLPFKMAIFISSFLPHSLDCGTITWERSNFDEKLLGTHTHGSDCTSLCGKQVNWRTDSRTSTEFEMVMAHQDTLDFAVQLLLRYSPDTDKTLINIPSVHVRGCKEPYEFVDAQMMRFFDPATSREMIHRGGHHFPRFEEELEELAEMVIDAVHMI